MIFSIGPCPVCGDSSRVIFAQNRTTGCLFVFCGACGIAWTDPEAVEAVDSLLFCKEVAPQGIELPTRTEIAAAGLDRLVQEEICDSEWWVDLTDYQE